MTLQRLRPHLRGHFFLFDPPAGATHAESVGRRLLIAAACLETLRLTAVVSIGKVIPFWFLSPLLLVIALVTVRFVVGIALSAIGLRPWRKWTTTERSYFFQTIAIANIIFALALRSRLQTRLADDAIDTLWNVFIPYLFYGFYQEVVYRGMIQLELVRRWGSVAGILVANILYTFGPLHYYYYQSGTSVAVPMFAAIFGIGLVFGVIFRRSGNLWIVGTMHAIGNAYMVTGTARPR